MKICFGLNKKKKDISMHTMMHIETTVYDVIVVKRLRFTSIRFDKYKLGFIYTISSKAKHSP